MGKFGNISPAGASLQLVPIISRACSSIKFTIFYHPRQPAKQYNTKELKPN